MDLISVIVPVYQVEGYLDRCVESIVNQTYKDLEIILVDDGSPDGCPRMCDEWAEKDNRIKVIHKENGGLSDARNVGMQLASGKYIGFVDSDDWIAPEMYGRLLSSIINDQSDIAACSVEMVWEDSSKRNLLTKKINAILDTYEAQKSLVHETILKHPVWYKLYRTELIKNIFFEIGKLHEDVFWSYQVIGKAKKISIIDYVGYYYWQRQGSIMSESYKLNRLDGIKAKVQRQQYFEMFMPALINEGIIDLWFTCLYHGQLILRFLKGLQRKKAMDYVKSIVRQYQNGLNASAGLTRTQMIWLTLSKISFGGTCVLRNLLGRGL